MKNQNPTLDIVKKSLEQLYQKQRANHASPFCPKALQVLMTSLIRLHFHVASPSNGNCQDSAAVQCTCRWAGMATPASPRDFWPQPCTTCSLCLQSSPAPTVHYDVWDILQVPALSRTCEL